MNTSPSPLSATISTALVTAEEAVTVAIADAEERARGYVRASRADSTRRAYASAWKRFSEWCAGHDLDALPATPHTVALYAAGIAEHYRP